MRSSSSGADVRDPEPRSYDERAIALPEGYRIELVARDLTFPTGVAFDGAGTPYVVESGYCYGERWTTPRLLRLGADGTAEVVAEGSEKSGPWTGVAFHDGSLIVVEGGALAGGRVLRITTEGQLTELVRDLPSTGDHHANGPAIDADGAIYFGIGTATNSGVVGEDSAKFGWLERHPEFHDIPGQDIVLTGRNFETPDLLAPDGEPPQPNGGEIATGAFSPFGQPTSKGQVIPGQVPCTGAVLKLPPGGGQPELVAWGFRNPFGLAFAPDGTLYVTDNGYDDRGSRPVWGSGDLLWAVQPGLWYGWPDYSGERPLTDDEFKPPQGEAVEFLLAEHPNPPPKPAAILGVHSSADGLDFSRSESFGHVGDAFIALFGDQSPTTGKLLAPVGFKIVRVDVATGIIDEFAANQGRIVEPASRSSGGGFERPIAVRFDPPGTALYVVDFGILTEGPDGAQPEERSGCLWRITRRGTP
jgi:glucose/arabinose dehydrogenase